MKRTVHTDDAPAAVGPYSQAISVTNVEYISVSGQIPLDPKTQEFVTGDIKVHTRQVLENLKAILEAAGSDLSKVIKCRVYLLRMADFAAMNEVYAEYFPEHPPARAAVAVSELPKGAMVEIEAEAYK